ncbi:MAG: caspase family protein [Chitinophagaceae bacterium]
MKWLHATLFALLIHTVASGQVKGLIVTKKDVADTSPIDFNRRVALVIGNSNYAKDGLRNPVNDANAIAELLRKYDFQVILDSNLNRSATLKRINAFGDSITRKKGVSFFYYSGHGVQYKSENYILPLTADIEKEEDIDNEAVKMETVFEKMSKTGNGLNIVILDACRNNIFQEKMQLAQGLNDKASTPGNSFVFYAASSGRTALDGTGKNSPFTESLLNNIKDSMEFFQVVKKVTKEVRTNTREAQKPAIGGSPEDDFIFLAKAAVKNSSSFIYKPEEITGAGPFASPSPVRERVHEPTGLGVSIKPTLYVLSVGVSEYKNLPALRYAAKDARDVATALTYQAGTLYDSVSSYLLINSTRYEILDAINSITEKAKAGDMIMFFFAGHNIKSSFDNTSYFLTADAAINAVDIPIDGGIEYELIRKFLANAPCKSILFMDGMYSPETASNLGEIENGVAVLTSTSENESSLEGTQWNNGLFAKTLIDGLSGFADEDISGHVSLAELSRYLSKKISFDSKGLQHPTVFIDPVLRNFKISKSLPQEILKKMQEANLPVLMKAVR